LGKRAQWPAEPRQYHWIVDGHNAIFAHRDLEAMQIAGQRAEARRRLEEMLEPFARRHDLKIQVVYDGNRTDRNPDSKRGGRVSTIYSLLPEQADDRILLIVSSRVARGEKVAVVSSDRATLGARLPAGVLRIEADEFLRRLREDRPRKEGERPEGDFGDIERHFLDLDEQRGTASDAPPAKGRGNGEGRRK